jgi:catechol 2,3-dioxygenase-like lactoylglutathione lyase family enzyme
MQAITGFHHLSLTVTDLDVSAAWYREVFGLQQIMEETYDGGRVLVFMQPETGVFLTLNAHEGNDGRLFAETRTGLDHVSFTVGSRSELTGWEKTLRDRGVRVSPISDQPWGSVLVFRDPDNIQLELCAPPAA